MQIYFSNKIRYFLKRLLFLSFCLNQYIFIPFDVHFASSVCQTGISCKRKEVPKNTEMWKWPLNAKKYKLSRKYKSTWTVYLTIVLTVPLYRFFSQNRNRSLKQHQRMSWSELVFIITNKFKSKMTSESLNWITDSF